jgi:flagellar biosynthesis/type III secretory pathway chaperone
MSSGISPQQCRETVARILADEITALKLLETLLRSEHTHLAENDIDALETASAARQDCVARLSRLGDERRDLCRMLGRGPDLAGLAALVAWCDPSGTLAPLLAEHAQRSTDCRDQNARNGALVGARMARISNMLGMLSGSVTPPVYGRGGQQAPTPTAGRLLAARA